MSAGLPGLGLGGLFFIVSALLAPFVELVRTVRGRSSRHAWLQVGRQFCLALTMIVAVELTLRGAYMMLAVGGLRDTGGDAGLIALPLAPLAITGGLLATVLIGAKAMQIGSRRILAGTGVAFCAWAALLVIGAAQLSTPLSTGEAEGREPVDPQAVASAGSEPAGERPTAPAQSHRADRGESTSADTPSDAGPAREPSDGTTGPTEQVPVGDAGSPGGAGSVSDTVPAAANGVPSLSSGPSEDAGPPADAGPSSANGSPPDHAGPPADAGPPETAGPPEHAHAGGRAADAAS